MRYKRFSAVSSIVLIYMLLAFIWWSVLLFHKNRDAYQAKIELQELGMTVEGLIKNEVEFHQTEQYKELKRNYRRQEVMILGEAVVLSLSVILAMYIVYRSYRQEINVSQQQHNFLLSITHELKSPIASVRLSLETIAKQHLRLKSDQIERLSKNAIGDADRLNKLVGNILLSARLESSYQFHSESVDISELLTKICDQFYETHPNVKIIAAIEQGVSPIIADGEAITSMMTNLIENAIKYSPTGTEIAIGLISKNTNFVEIKVADKGMGIPKKEKTKVFDKFYRIGNENTRSTKGTGLGLNIVYEIVKGHGGKISIHDNKPQGAVFSILLPIKGKAKRLG